MPTSRDKSRISPPILWLVLALAPFAAAVSAQNDTSPSAAEIEAMENYMAAKAAGRDAEAVKYLLDYMENDQGEHAPMTISLMQRYGNLLLEDGESREAVSVLKEARERAIATFGEHGPELFEINLDLGNAYAERESGIGRSKRYFDAALDVLRKNDQRDTILYVKTLVAAASGLTQAGALEGGLSADTSGDGIAELLDNGFSSVMRRFESGYAVLDEYLQEAVELADALEFEDPYLTAKIAIVRSKIKVRETLVLEAVSPSVRGSISTASAENRYLLEDGNLSSAIDILMGDADLNRDYLDIANGARMEVAWLSKDMERMTGFCSGNTLNMASTYPPDRLFEVADDGSVIAPRFPFRISTNIFSQIGQKLRDPRFSVGTSRSTNSIQQDDVVPYFVPVCIDGRLMATLINAPKVTIEEIE